MPRNCFRRSLPDGDSIRKNRFVAVFGSAPRHLNLWRLNRRSAAGGNPITIPPSAAPEDVTTIAL
jgi:hypothetical protein